ncbi:MAG TPA: class I SAM-dependent methyltransferase [Terriglobales bacterium]|nr:class I SAM-dependent methyltransferase [Terriglobales bacterium]
MLDCALGPSGEAASYFARSRIERLQTWLQRLGVVPTSVLDYGCGIGGSVPFLREILRPNRILGVDVSPESLVRARQEHGGEGIEFANSRHFLVPSEFQLAFCNGVFHHIPPDHRPAALRYIYDSLVGHGVLALWENNPWNPATRYVMGRCEFDRDAMPISPTRARGLVRKAGFQVLHVSSYFYFPHWLRWLWGLEPSLSRLPLGAQYLVLARKPG